MDLIVAIHTVSGSQCFQHIPKMSDCPCQNLSTLHPTTAFGVQKWQLTLHSQDPGSNAVVSLPTFREQSSTF